ncbi:unnamed protein product [Lymnaea stagnalis]|uniref:Uncharacterized protein n=1 Tax=Lymnaea stagnalis TaxID=6523 RepID=A0AAV2ICF8_LYMST
MAKKYDGVQRESTRRTEQSDISDLAHLSKRVKHSSLSESSKFEYGNMEPDRVDPGQRENFKLTCPKIKDHDKFIPIAEFKNEDLPVEYQSTDLIQSVMALADLTVRVRCKYTSSSRPKVHQASGTVYPFYRDRGRNNIIRTGTGRVWHVMMLENSGEPCSCHRCEGTKTRQGRITILTATHVVFNSSEARATSVDFFFDDESRSSCVTLKAEEVYVADAVSDRCYFDCYTCDVELLQKLSKIWIKWLTLCKTVREEHQNSEAEIKLAIMVAHPHGLPKQVSVGRWFEIQDSVDSVHFYTYDCPTCPGSSGAYVYTLARQGWWSNHVHSGANLSLNYSGSGIDWGWCTVAASTT